MAIIDFAIAASVIGREAAASMRAALPDFDSVDAVTWVAEHLPFEVGAVLEHDDRRSIVHLNLD